MPKETILKVVARQDLAGADLTRAMEVTGPGSAPASRGCG